MRRVRSTAEDRAYGLGFWLEGDAVYLTGSDTGASFISQHLPGRFTWSVLGNTTDGAWPVSRRLDELLPVAGVGLLLTRGSVLDAASPGVHSPAHAHPIALARRSRRPSRLRPGCLRQ